MIELLPCFFPSCVSKVLDSRESTCRIEDAAGGFIAECEACCGGTGTMETAEAAANEWNAVARSVQGSGVHAGQAPVPPTGEAETSAAASLLRENQELREKNERLTAEARRARMLQDLETGHAL